LENEYSVTVLDNLSTGLRDNLPESDKTRFIIGDVRDFELVSAAIEGHEYVVHPAAQAFIPLSYELPLQIAETNAEEKEVTIDESRLRPNDLETLVTDNSRANKILGWRPETTFKEGIRRTIRWYIDNHKMWGYERHGWQWRY